VNDPVEFLALNATIKAVDSENPNGEFEVILSTDAVDRDGEAIMPGAFEPLPKKIPIFVDHDWRKGAQPVAKAVPFYEDGVLKARGVYASTARAQEIRSLVNDEILDSMSVGFLNGKREKVNGQKSVTKADLFESSFTAIPVNTQAQVLASKAIAEAEEKAGARHSAADLAHVQTMHDTAVALGAACGQKHVHDADTPTIDDPAPAEVDTLSLNGSADPAAADAAAESADEAAQALARLRLLAARASVA
jgi:HK97 family phage prohead protease